MTTVPQKKKLTKNQHIDLFVFWALNSVFPRICLIQILNRNSEVPQDLSRGAKVISYLIRDLLGKVDFSSKAIGTVKGGLLSELVKN